MITASRLIPTRKATCFVTVKEISRRYQQKAESCSWDFAGDTPWNLTASSLRRWTTLRARMHVRQRWETVPHDSRGFAFGGHPLQDESYWCFVFPLYFGGCIGAGRPETRQWRGRRTWGPFRGRTFWCWEFPRAVGWWDPVPARRTSAWNWWCSPT